MTKWTVARIFTVVGLGGSAAAAANFMPLPVAIALGVLSGVGALAGSLLWERRSTHAARELAWSRMVGIGPVNLSPWDTETSKFAGLLNTLHPQIQAVKLNRAHVGEVRRLRRLITTARASSRSVVCVDGPPACGKTRLLLEVASELTALGERCGWVVPGKGPLAVEAAVNLGEPTVLIFDDAATRNDVAETLDALHGAGSDSVTVVLVARSFAVWWQRIRAALPSDRAIRLPLDADFTLRILAQGKPAQLQAFTQALKAFNGSSLTKVKYLPSELAAPILMIHAAALLTARGYLTGVIAPEAIEQVFFAREEEQWMRTVTSAFALNELRAAILLALLVGFEGPDDAAVLLQHHPGLATHTTRQRSDLVEVLRCMYPQQQPFWLCPHLPGYLAERYAAHHLAVDRELAEVVGSAASTRPDALARVLTILANAATHTHHACQAIENVILPDCAKRLPIAIEVARDCKQDLDQTLAQIATHATHLSRAELATLLSALPDSRETNQLAVTTVAIYRGVISANSSRPDEHAAARAALGKVLVRQGRHREAETELKAAIDSQVSNLGKNHTDTLNTRRELALCMWEQGYLEQAEASYRAVLIDQSGALGKKHPQVLVTRARLVGVIRDLGRFEEAESECRAVLAEQYAVQGVDHRDVFETHNLLATVLSDRLRYKEAEAEHCVALAGHRQILGESHPATLGTRYSLATTLIEQGRLEKAETELRAVLAQQRAILGKDHPDTLITRHALAVALRKRGQLEEAETEQRAVLTQQRAILGKDHPKTLLSAYALARVLHDLARFDDAETEYDAVLDRQRTVLGQDHPRTVDSIFGLVRVMESQGRLSESEARLRALLSSVSDDGNKCNLRILEMRHFLAHLLLRQQRFIESEEVVRHVLDVGQQILPRSHPLIGHCGLILKASLHGLGRTDEVDRLIT